MSDLQRAEKRAIVLANVQNADEAASKLFVCYHSDGKMDSAAIYARKVIEIGKQRDDSEIWIEGYIKLAVAQMDTPNLDSAHYYLNLILSETKNSEETHMTHARASAYMFFGAMYQTNNLDEEEAFLYFRKAINTSKKSNNTHVYVRSNTALINNLMTRKRYDEVRSIIEDAEFYLEERELKTGNAVRYLKKDKALFLATIATTEKERMAAMNLMLSEYKKADSLDLHRHKAMIFIDIALHFVQDMPKQELVEIAEENFHAAKDKVSDSVKGGLYEAYGHVLMHSKQYKKAIPYLKKAKEYLVETKTMENYLSVCEELVFAYEKTNQFEKIISEFYDYKRFQDSLIVKLYSDQLLELEEKYKTEKKESENVLLQAENNMILTRFRFSYIIGFLLLGLLLTGLFFYQKMKKNKKQLESINEDKNKLFAILAHDLRNPISSLSNLSEKVKFLTENNRLNELDEMAKQTDVKLSALNDNLNNILLWAVTESNLVGIRPEQVSLQKEVNKINELYADDISRKSIIVNNKIPESTYVYTDVTVLQTIIRNLISNAIKFSYEGGSIEYSISNRKGQIELRVIDMGVGLIEIEENGAKNTSIRRKAKGTGIGLKICKELAVKSNLVLSIVPNQEGGTIGIIRFKKAG